MANLHADENLPLMVNTFANFENTIKITKCIAKFRLRMAHKGSNLYAKPRF